MWSWTPSLCCGGSPSRTSDAFAVIQDDLQILAGLELHARTRRKPQLEHRDIVGWPLDPVHLGGHELPGIRVDALDLRGAISRSEQGFAWQKSDVVLLALRGRDGVQRACYRNASADHAAPLQLPQTPFRQEYGIAYPAASHPV